MIFPKESFGNYLGDGAGAGLLAGVVATSGGLGLGYFQGWVGLFGGLGGVVICIRSAALTTLGGGRGGGLVGRGGGLVGRGGGRGDWTDIVFTGDGSIGRGGGTSVSISGGWDSWGWWSLVEGWREEGIYVIGELGVDLVEEAVKGLGSCLEGVVAELGLPVVGEVGEVGAVKDSPVRLGTLAQGTEVGGVWGEFTDVAEGQGEVIL